VTDCPAGGYVTTETIPLYTTVCPVTTTSSATPTSTSTSAAEELTTSTVYTTKVYTVTSCAPTVTDCPSKPYVTTETIPLYTTVCPVSAKTTTTSPYKGSKSPTTYCPESTSTTTKTTTLSLLTTVKAPAPSTTTYVYQTMTVVPQPSGYNKTTAASKPVGTGAAYPGKVTVNAGVKAGASLALVALGAVAVFVL
jgi:chitinase